MTQPDPEDPVHTWYDSFDLQHPPDRFKRGRVPAGRWWEAVGGWVVVVEVWMCGCMDAWMVRDGPEFVFSPPSPPYDSRFGARGPGFNSGAALFGKRVQEQAIKMMPCELPATATHKQMQSSPLSERAKGS